MILLSVTANENWAAVELPIETDREVTQACPGAMHCFLSRSMASFYVKYLLFALFFPVALKLPKPTPLSRAALAEG
jgi:hypothetical protein